ICPLQVIQQESHRAGRGKRSHEAGYLPEELLLLIVPPRGEWRRQRCWRWLQIGQEAPQLRPTVEDLTAYGDLRSRIEFAQRLDEWGEGHGLLGLVTAACRNDKATASRSQRRLLGQPRLADARLAGHDDTTAGASQCRRQRSCDRAYLRRTRHQWRLGRRAQVGAHRERWEDILSVSLASRRAPARGSGKELCTVASLELDDGREQLGGGSGGGSLAALEHGDVGGGVACALGELLLGEASQAPMALEQGAEAERIEVWLRHLRPPCTKSS